MPLQTQDSLLDVMLCDMEEAPALFRPTRFWAKIIPEIVFELRESGVEKFKSLPSALRWFVPRYGDPENFEQLDLDQILAPFANCKPLAVALRNMITGMTIAKSDLQVIIAADIMNKAPRLNGISEDPFGSPLEMFPFGREMYSAGLLRYMKTLVFLKKYANTSMIRNVWEIGGGYGTLGEILLKSHPDHYFYVDIDIPPVAYVATRYLQRIFGKDAIASYEDLRNEGRIDIDELRAQGYRGCVLCPWQLERLSGTFELFVNAVSFQEMEPNIVENYAHFVQKHTSHYILLKNMIQGKNKAEKENDVGVCEPVTASHYEQFFSAFHKVCSDFFVFGDYSQTMQSEVALYSRLAKS